MDEAHQRLRELADAARRHSWNEGRLELLASDPAAVDQLLVRLRDEFRCQRSDTGVAHLEGLAACYGAWLGCWAVTALKAHWVGLHEPAAPRLSVGGETFSPIDAVRRILLNQPDAASVVEIIERFRAAKREFDAGAKQHRERNRSAWDQRAEDDRFAGSAVLPEDPAQAAAAIDPWIRAHGVAGRDLLCLAGGGGLHAPLYAIAGARVTVVDLSPQQLAHDRRFAQETGIEMRIVCQSIDDLSDLDDASFDFVVQPVSTCYLPDVTPMYREVARVMRPGGVYLSQHKQPGSLQADFGAERLNAEHDSADRASPYRVVTPAVDGLRLPAPEGGCAEWVRESGTAEYLHPLDTLIGGLCDAGFIIAALREPPRADVLAPPGSFEHRARYLPPYLKIKAVRQAGPSRSSTASLGD